MSTTFEWNISEKTKACNPESKKCQLCLTKKYHIILTKRNLPISRNELVTKCRQRINFSELTTKAIHLKSLKFIHIIHCIDFISHPQLVISATAVDVSLLRL